MKCGFLLFPELEELDLIGPWEILTMWQKELGNQNTCFTVAQTAETIKCAKGLSICPDYTFANCPHIDCLVIPGGWGTRAEVNNPELIGFIKKAAQTADHVLTICTGVFLLNETGFLTDQEITTHWRSIDRLRDATQAKVVQKRWTNSGNLWTSAGISAGTDMALAFVKAISGEAIAGKVQLNTEYFPDPVVYDKGGNPLPLYASK